MAKFNFGVIKASFTRYMNESQDFGVKESFKDFINLLKESEFLKFQNAVYSNIENKYLQKEELAIKYIDQNVALLKDKGFTRELFEAENAKLLPLAEGIKLKVSDRKKKLYENLHILIQESLPGKKLANVDKLHEAFTEVLAFVTSNKPMTLGESTTIELPSLEVSADFIMQKAVEKFSEKYSKVLSETEKKIFKDYVETENDQQLFEDYKKLSINLLEKYTTELTESISESIDQDERRELEGARIKVEESIEKISNMKYDEEKFFDQISDLSELNEELS
jgi:pyruvate-formate lyase